jgi:hypothetical protein
VDVIACALPNDIGLTDARFGRTGVSIPGLLRAPARRVTATVSFWRR